MLTEDEQAELAGLEGQLLSLADDMGRLKHSIAKVKHARKVLKMRAAMRAQHADPLFRKRQQAGLDAKWADPAWATAQRQKHREARLRQTIRGRLKPDEKTEYDKHRRKGMTATQALSLVLKPGAGPPRAVPAAYPPAASESMPRNAGSEAVPVSSGVPSTTGEINGRACEVQKEVRKEAQGYGGNDAQKRQGQRQVAQAGPGR